MIARNPQAQTLITAIDDVLKQENSRLPWIAIAQSSRQRRLLQRLRHYLQHSITHPEFDELTPWQQSGELDFSSGQPSPHPFSTGRFSQPGSLGGLTNDTADLRQDPLRSVTQEINELRTGVLRPLHAEVANLMQQRSQLLQEIHQLASHKQTHLLEQSGGTLSTQTQPSLPSQIIHLLESKEPVSGLAPQPDSQLNTLDLKLRVVFDALQRDIQTYQNSLSQGIERMHTLGQQSETLFAQLVHRLATQMGQDQIGYFPPSDPAPPAMALTDDLRHFLEQSAPSETLAAAVDSHPAHQSPQAHSPAARSQAVTGSPASATDAPHALNSPASNPENPLDKVHSLTELLSQVTLEAESPLPPESPLPAEKRSQGSEVGAIHSAPPTPDPPTIGTPELESLPSNSTGMPFPPPTVTRDSLGVPTTDLRSHSDPITNPNFELTPASPTESLNDLDFNPEDINPAEIDETTLSQIMAELSIWEEHNQLDDPSLQASDGIPTPKVPDPPLKLSTEEPDPEIPDRADPQST